MGMYTTFRCICLVKKEYIEYIKEISDGNAYWKDYIKQMPFVKNFSKLYRADFIPYSSMSAYNEDKFYKESFSEINKWGMWNFCCDLKNYGSEIETFIYEVLPNLCEQINLCAYWYEEDDYPKIIFEKEILKKEV